MIVRTRADRQTTFPNFHLAGNILTMCNEYMYLGHVISDDLSDDKDIFRQRRKLYAQANTLCRKFSMCSVPVKIALFKAYCTSLYTAHLWSRYKQESMRKLKVAYDDSMRLLLRAPRCSSASHMFVSIGVPTCPEVLRNLMYRFMCRTTESENVIITALTNPVYSSCRFSSELRKHWRTCLQIRH